MDSGSPVRAFFGNRWVRLVLVLDAIAVVAVIIFMIINAMKTSVLYFNVTPLDATISVNGNIGYTNGSYRMLPGDYEIAISHEGMTTKTFNVELGGDSIVNIITYLANEDGGFEFYEMKDDYSSYIALTEMATAGNNTTTDQDTSAEEFVERMEEDIAVYTSGVLPIKYYDYEIENEREVLKRKVVIKNGYGTDECAKTLCIEALMLFTEDKELVSDLLIENGLNVEDYEIIYEIY